MKIVIFDDELHQNRTPLAVTGFEIIVCANADDALAVVEREAAEIVLMDFSMAAERTGAHAIGALRMHFSPKPPFIVAISGDAVANEQMLDAGADDAVPKSHIVGYLKILRQRRLGY